MKFYNTTDKDLQVKDGGGNVEVGPFSPGTAEKGPWYDSYVVPDYWWMTWQRAGKVRVVE